MIARLASCYTRSELRSSCPQLTISSSYHGFAEETGPNFTQEELKFFQFAMKKYMAEFAESGKDCRGDSNGLIDDVVNGNERLTVGPGYTWHTHPCGAKPSPQDIRATINLKRRYLCIGHAPSKKTICYDLQQEGKEIGRY